jgi:predicted transcriptional regulator
MLTKEEVNKQIKSLPDQCTLDELIERLLIVEKVSRGLKDVEEGRTVTEAELDKRMEKWFG